MAKTIWRGQTANLEIGQIQTATKAHISKYVFYSDTADLAGVAELDTASTAVEAQASVNSSKNYTITSYLLYKHNFNGSTTVATSNKVDNVLTVHEPLDEKSLIKIEPNTSGYNDWVWSNASAATFAITPTFASNAPYSKIGIYVSDATDPTAPKGSIAAFQAEDISAKFELAWEKTTGSTTDLGVPSQNITVRVKSTTQSAPTERIIEGKTATFVVKNAVTGLSGLSNKTLYAGSAAVEETVIITPSAPYSKNLILVNDKGQDVEGNITSTGGAIVELDGQKIRFNASKVTPGTETQTIKFKVRSRQSNAAVDTNFITFVVNAVANITGQTVVEGQSIRVAAGIGTIASATVTSGPVTVTHSAGDVIITGTAVDKNTPWVVTVKNAAGATITISGTTTYLTDVSTSINTGDYIIIGTDTLTELGTSIAQIVTQPTKGKASITEGKLKYEASTKDGPIAAATYSIKVKGANGATRTVNIVVSNITATLS